MEKQINPLEWQKYLYCNGEVFAKEVDWFTPNVYSNNFEYPPDKAGVYVFIVYANPKDLGNVVYIGSANSLMKRYSGHPVKAALYQMYWYVRFYFIECDDYREKEKNMIKKFKPKYNIQHKGHRSLNYRFLNPTNATNG